MFYLAQNFARHYTKVIRRVSGGSMKKQSRSRELAARVVYAALQVLKENGGEMRSRDVMNEVEKRVELDAWAKQRYEKTGYIRWQSILHFFTIDCVKAGFLVKKGGIWYLTTEGEDALSLGETALLDRATAAYRTWRTENPKETVLETGETQSEDQEASESITIEQIQQVVSESIERHMRSKNPYEFQDLAAALLRGMGYYTPFVAPRGKDGGVDVIAYRDPLGTVSPRIKAQIKHRETPATVQEIRQLMGILQKDGDVGIFISTGGFTSDAKKAARGSHVHVELIDLSRFIDLWEEHYYKLTDEDKALLPLAPIYYLASLD
jgi:restriction system protein